MTRTFKVFKYGSTPWLIVLLTSLNWLGCGLISYLITNIYFTSDNLLVFLGSFTVLMLTGTFAISKLKYRVAGHLGIDDKGIEIQINGTERLEWTEVKSICVRRIDHVLIRTFDNVGGAIRYFGVGHNVDYSEFYFDKIKINDRVYYLLIKSREDAKTLEQLLDYLRDRVPTRDELTFINFSDLFKWKRFDTEVEL
jgi:hypothetical protein